MVGHDADRTRTLNIIFKGDLEDKSKRDKFYRDRQSRLDRLQQLIEHYDLKYPVKNQPSRTPTAEELRKIIMKSVTNSSTSYKGSEVFETAPSITLSEGQRERYLQPLGFTTPDDLPSASASDASDQDLNSSMEGKTGIRSVHSVTTAEEDGSVHDQSNITVYDADKEQLEQQQSLSSPDRLATSGPEALCPAGETVATSHSTSQTGARTPSSGIDDQIEIPESDRPTPSPLSSINSDTPSLVEHVQRGALKRDAATAFSDEAQEEASRKSVQKPSGVRLKLIALPTPTKPGASGCETKHLAAMTPPCHEHMQAPEDAEQQILERDATSETTAQRSEMTGQVSRGPADSKAQADVYRRRTLPAKLSDLEQDSFSTSLAEPDRPHSLRAEVTPLATVVKAGDRTATVRSPPSADLPTAPDRVTNTVQRQYPYGLRGVDDVESRVQGLVQLIKIATHEIVDDLALNDVDVKFVLRPEPELELLYKRMMCSDGTSWKSTASQLGLQGFRMQQMLAMCIGAAIHEEIFCKKLPWKTSRDILEEPEMRGRRESLSQLIAGLNAKGPCANIEYLITQSGADMLREGSEFDRSTIMPEAQSLAENFLLTLRSQLRCGRAKLNVPEGFSQSAISALAQIFRKALLLKGGLQEAPHKFEYTSSASMAPFIERDMHEVRSLDGVGVVVGSVFPGIWIRDEQGGLQLVSKLQVYGRPAAKRDPSKA